MKEELFVTARSNPLIDPGLHIWTWEVAMYLFLGGLTAGIMAFAAYATLARKDEEAPFAATRLALLAPIVLSLGMTTLFLDLEHKLFVFRFYTAFQLLSPMSWGAWILVVIYPVSMLQILSTLRSGYPQASPWLDRFAAGRWLLDWCEAHRRHIALTAIGFGIALGIYTGILLSAFSARPFWNSGVLGPLFLVSGLSTAAALVALVARQHSEKVLFTRMDLVLIAAELALVAIRGFARRVAIVAPVLVLLGGYVLRQVMVDVGQESTWTRYDTQYNSELMQRLHD
jgi:formate-dependent nitrite reductase membrane component NrfD